MSTPPIELACRIAVRAHTGQLDKNGDPYIKHPAMVAALARHLAADPGGDEQVSESAVAVAWLHDVVEDTMETPLSLREAGIDYVVVAAAHDPHRGNHRSRLLRSHRREPVGQAREDRRYRQ